MLKQLLACAAGLRQPAGSGYIGQQPHEKRLQLGRQLEQVQDHGEPTDRHGDDRSTFASDTVLGLLASTPCHFWYSPLIE